MRIEDNSEHQRGLSKLMLLLKRSPMFALIGYCMDLWNYSVMAPFTLSDIHTTHWVKGRVIYSTSKTCQHYIDTV